MPKDKAKDILSLIQAEHRQVEKLLAEAEKADSAKMYQCFNQIYETFTLHARSEQLVFYTAMRGYEETKKYVKESQDEHEKALVILEQMKELKPTDSEFKIKIGQLKKAIKNHVETEESKIFNVVRQYMSDPQLIRLAQEFRKAKAQLEEEVKLAMTT